MTLEGEVASLCFDLMRGKDTQQSAMFSYVSAERRVPVDHPLRSIRAMVDVALKGLSRSFGQMYTEWGRPTIAPEKLLRALLLQLLYSIRSERLLMEQLEYNLLFRWFVGLNMDEPVWVPSVFGARIATGCWRRHRREVLSPGARSGAGERSYCRMSISAWTARSSKPGQARRVFSATTKIGLRRRTTPATRPLIFTAKSAKQRHASIDDGSGGAGLARKGSGHESKLAYCGNVLIENRNGLVVDTALAMASGTAERAAAVEMAERIEGEKHVSVGADKGYDTRGFVRDMRDRNVTPHVSQNTLRSGGSALDRRTTRHAGYQVSQRKRKRIEEVFGWLKTVGMLRKTRHRGIFKVGWVFTFAAAAYNLVRMRNLAVVPSA